MSQSAMNKIERIIGDTKKVIDDKMDVRERLQAKAQGLKKVFNSKTGQTLWVKAKGAFKNPHYGMMLLGALFLAFVIMWMYLWLPNPPNNGWPLLAVLLVAIGGGLIAVGYRGRDEEDEAERKRQQLAKTVV
jgi:hypothetical protein